MRSRYQLDRMSSASRISSRSAPRAARRRRCSCSRAVSPSFPAASASLRACAPRACAICVTPCAAAAGSNSGARYTVRASAITCALRSSASGSSKRSARSSLPPATRASASSRSPLMPRDERCALIAGCDSRRKGTCWQRERIVGASGPRSSATRTITAYGGGSSRSFRRASAASSFSKSAPKTRYTRRSASKGRMCRSRRRARIGSMRIWSPSGSSTYRSGCARRVTRSASPRSSPAAGGAGRRFPTPRGPWKRYACAGPSTSAARRSAFASSCSGKVSKLSTDGLGKLVGLLGPVDGNDTLGEDLGELAVGAVDVPGELGALALDPVRLLVLAGRGLLERQEQEKGAVGQETARGEQVELEHALDAQAAREPLVGERGVDVAVADDIGAADERRPDDLVDELRAGGGEERGLGPWGDGFAGEQKLTDALTQRRPARLAGVDNVSALLPQPFRKEPDLSCLAGAVDPFEGDEHEARLG